MNNTINNVPRQLLEVIEQTWRIHYQGGPATTDIAADAIEKGLGQLRALLSAPSPAGLDGLDTDRNAAFKACPESGCDWGSFYLGWKARGEVEQAIIDGLRGEVDKLMTTFVRVADHLHIDCEKAKSAPGKPSDVFIAAIDQQAQRIGELEGLLRHAQKQVPTGSGLHMRIDAALSAGKE